jgi:uncharacterized protein (TIGR02246 family)
MTASPAISDADAIRAVIAAWLAATKEGNVATVAALMTDDVVFLVPGRLPFGKAEFLAASAAMAGMTIDGRSNIEDLGVSGDMAYVRSRLQIEITPQPGSAVVRKSGYTLSIFRRSADGQWRLARDANLVA